jgi:glutathione peroxidase
MRGGFVSVLGALLLGGGMLAGCGSGGDEEGGGAPAAASDAGVQRAAASDADAGSDAARGGGVLRGTFTRLDGERDDLARYRGDVVLVVNTATECGYTPQLKGLEALYRRHRSDGLVVLGFPANDFAGQEPRSDDEIAEFCEANYGVTFPMFAKTAVTGKRANALFRRLGAAAGAPEWNFNKYLVDRGGEVVARFGAGTEPDAAELVKRLDALL